jgi:hypothetical protein
MDFTEIHLINNELIATISFNILNGRAPLGCSTEETDSKQY